MENTILTFLNISILLINSFLVYRTFISERKKLFEDTLFEKKLALYQEIIKDVYLISDKLRYDLEPFDSIHRINNKNDWEEFHLKEILPLTKHGLSLRESISRNYGLLLPQNILKTIEQIAFYATRYVIESSHYDGEHILKIQSLLNNEIFKLLEMMRQDLDIDKIDSSLRNRLLENTM